MSKSLFKDFGCLGPEGVCVCGGGGDLVKVGLLCRFPRSAGELFQRNYGIILLEYSFIILTAMAANIKVLYR